MDSVSIHERGGEGDKEGRDRGREKEKESERVRDRETSSVSPLTTNALLFVTFNARLLLHYRFCFPAEKKTAIGVVDGILDEAGELVSICTLTSTYNLHKYVIKVLLCMYGL